MADYRTGKLQTKECCIDNSQCGDAFAQLEYDGAATLVGNSMGTRRDLGHLRIQQLFPESNLRGMESEAGSTRRIILYRLILLCRHTASNGLSLFHPLWLALPSQPFIDSRSGGGKTNNSGSSINSTTEALLLIGGPTIAALGTILLAS